MLLMFGAPLKRVNGSGSVFDLNMSNNQRKFNERQSPNRVMKWVISATDIYKSTSMINKSKKYTDKLHNRVF